MNVNWKKVLPVAFGILGAGGTVGAVILSAKDTEKAMGKLKEAEEAKGEPLTKKERFKVAAPCYIRTGIATAASAGLTLASTVMGEKIRGDLIAGSVYSLKKIRDAHMARPDTNGIESIEIDESEPNEKMRVWIEDAEQWVETTMEGLYFAELVLNRELNNYSWGRYEISLKDVLDQFDGVDLDKPAKDGRSLNEIGWNIDYVWDMMNVGWVDFFIHKDPEAAPNEYNLSFSVKPDRFVDITPRD